MPAPIFNEITSQWQGLSKAVTQPLNDKAHKITIIILMHNHKIIGLFTSFPSCVLVLRIGVNKIYQSFTLR